MQKRGGISRDWEGQHVDPLDDTARRGYAEQIPHGKDKDGRTPYHRLKGRKFNQAVAEFGECIWYLKPKSEGKYKADVRWEDGIWLGIRDRTGETLVGTPDGIVNVRSII